MVTNFIVNKHDLQFILQQIKISEAHASGTDITEAIRQVYGVDAEDAALLPAGLRTVDGTLNNLLPGQAYFGAAQTKFPRLLDPVYRNDNDGDSIDFDGPGPSPAITNTDYGVIDGQGHVGTGTVVDADPRTISNLIATQDVSNPAAIRAALKLAGVEGPAQTAATNAISAAYRSTLNANGANAEVAAATAVVAEASANASAANAVLAAAAALQSLYAAGLSAAEGLPATMTTAQTAVQGLIAALLEITDEPAPVSEFNLSPPDQATFIDTVAYTAAHEAWLASDQTATEPQPTDFPDVDGYNAAKATFDNELEAQTLAEAQYDTAFAAYNATLATATLAYDTAVTAVGNAEAAAGDVVTALGDSTTPGVLTLQAMATTLRTAIEGIAVGTLNSGDAETVSGALADFTGAPGLAQSNMDDLGALKSIADTDLAAAQAEADEASAVLDAANAELAIVQAAADTSGTPEEAAAALQDLLDQFGIQVGEDGGLIIENQSPDIGLSASFNTAMTIFGQFFDHGLDLVNKGGNGTVYIPLEADDPLIAGADKVFGTADDLPEHLRFMTLTRATPTWDADGTAQHVNATTPWVDQNQTYTSHASHQVFLREYVRKNIGDGEKAYSTGHLLDGKASSGFGNKDGALANWGEVKAQALSMLGIRLQDTDVHRVPLLLTDQYGNLILGNQGYAQLVMTPDDDHAETWLKEGTAQGVTTEGSFASGVAFLADIAHTAVPTDLLDANGEVRTVDHDRNPGTPEVPVTAIAADGDDVAGNAVGTNQRGQITEYDNELLDRHFISGDGRGNENIGLTAIHTVFHSEHNRVVEANKQTILDSGDRAFINEWLLVDLGPNDPIPTSVDDPALEWDGARLFQAGRFSTEMQYQHMVFEEFARRIQPAIDPFVFTNTADIDGSIIAEFAHTVYRFGHSMLNGSVDRLDNDLGVVGGGDQLSLIEAFLNPVEYLDGGTDVAAIQGALLRGMSRDVGNEIDEFVVPALQSNLLGLPLDLAALNIARGRETGVPSLNETRAQLSDDFGLPDLKPYTSWNDFVQNIKNPLSVINFIAAYGTHATVENAGTLQAKRDAATLLVLGGAGAPEDRIDFLNARGDYVSEKGGLDNVDLWIGGLAERLNEFGGMLGSTFNFIFEYQMERLQNGDRFYYLSRTQGLNMLNQLEQNTFSDIIMRNSDLGDKYATHLSSHIFVTPDMILELDRGIAQEDYNPDDTSPNRSGFDPVWDDPILQSLDPKVTRSYSGVTADGGHDVGGTLRFRGGEHVVIGGTEGDDRLISDIGDDTIWGDGGDDYINSGQGADEVYGGDGDDIIEDPFGENFLRGNAGNDVISTARGFTLAFGNEGSDAIFLGQDAAEAFGDEGNDFILGSSGPDLLHGGEGDDWIEGGEGFDVIAGENSELFFNSSIIGHDVAWGQGNDQDYDLESGDDIALSGIGVQRFEGMFGFDWSTAKFDVAGVDHDMAIPIFTTDPQQILRDRFDQMEALSGWKFDDRLSGDDRGQVLGGVGPGAEAEASFINHILTQEGIDRIDGLEEWMGGARETLFGAVPGADVSSYRDGNILMGGNGNDIIMGRGGYDLIDGDAWLNVRIRIMVGGTEYTAESLTTDTTVAGAKAGRIYNVETGELAFGGRSLKSLLLDRTIKPGDMSIVREIKYDDTPQNNIDTAVFRGTFAEYSIEGRGHFIDFNGDGDFDDPGEDVAQAAYDLNGDGFIAVTDLDDGRTGAIVDGVAMPTRNQLTDDTDLLKNIEMLQFSDQTIDIRNAANGTNQRATGLVEIADPTQLLGGVTPFVGQVLSAAAFDLADADGLTLGANGLPQGFQIEWQSMLGGKPTWTTVATNQIEYTVRETDIEGSLRAVAVFKDNNGITERVYSAATATPTAPFSVEENAAPGTMVTTQIPPTHEGEAGQFHQIRAGFDAGGRFEVVQSGQDFLGNPLYQLVVAGGDMDYEFQDPFQIVDNQYQIVIDTYDLDPAAGGDLIDSREFTILLQDVVEAPPAIVLSIADAPMQVETGDTGATNLVFGLSVDNPGFSGTLAVSFSVGAAAGQSQAVSFVDGVGTLIVPVDNDDVDDGAEMVGVTLTGATGTGVVATLGTATASGMVTEDDIIPVILSIANAPTMAEAGDTGTTDLAFGLSLDDTSFSGTLQVSFDTGTATNQTQTVNFTNGVGTLTMSVANDDVDDGDEMVTVTLTGATGTGAAVTLGTATASGMVTEDDVAPPPVDVLLSITNAPTLAETGDTGTTDLAFGLSLDDTTFSGTLTVTYDTGTAANQSQDVSFTNGVGTLTMSVANDDVDDGDEMVTVTLTGATGTGVAVTLGTATASGTVTEDDVAAPPDPGSVLPIDFNASPLLSYSGQDQTPQGFQIDQDGAGITLSGNTWKKTLLPGGTFTVDADTVLRFDVTMQNGTAEFVSIGLENDDNYKTTDDLLFQVFGSINIARFDQSVRNDYTTVGQTVSYEIPLAAHAGRTFDYLALINDDDAAQSSIVRFSNVQLVQGSAPPPPPPTGPVLSITDALTVAETGDTGTTDLDFGLSLSDASFTGTLQVTYNAGSATNQTQAVSFTGGIGTLTVQVPNDDLANGPETVPVTLTGATGTATPVTLGTATASGTVTEDDVAAPPDPGSVLPIDFNASPLLSYSGQDQTPQGFQIDQDGAGITLSGNTWKKTLLPGGTFTVDADTVLRFDVTMQNGTAEFVSIGLENDDNYKTTDDLLFQVFGSINIARFDQSVRNDYTTVGQTVSYEIPLAAHAGRTFDYLALINDDDAAQSSIVRFSNVQLVQGSAPPPPPPTGPVLSITDALTVAETGDTGTTDLDFGLSLSDASFNGTLQVSYNAGSATNQTQAVSFAGGIGTLTVQVPNDDLANGPETVPVTLTGATGTATPVTLGTATASGTVTEDDVAAPPASVVLSIADAPTLTETGDTGTTDLVFDLSLSDASFTGSLQVAYDTGTATSQSVSFVDGIGMLTVSVANDDVDNGTETVTVTLTGASGAGPTVTLGTATASGMVIEDDVTGGGGTVSTVVTPIGASSDDWEQFGGGGSGDLEFGLNGSRAQAVGMRFDGIDIPQTATITDAYLQFTSLQTSSGTANFTIGIQGSETAATFSSGAPPQSRVTADEFAWSNVEQWTAGGTYRTPDISGLIETVIGADGATNAALAFIVEGSGSRVASSFDSGGAPELVLVLDDGSALTL